MTNSELVENYLTNRLTESEKAAFDLKVNSDPSLKADVDLQKKIIESIKNARAAELKSMLNNVSIAPPASTGFSNFKIAAGIIGAGILIGSLYYYLRPGALTDGSNLSTSIQDSVQGNQPTENPERIIPIEEPPASTNEIVAKQKEEVEAEPKKVENKIPSEVNQPKIDVIDPTEEMSSDENQNEKVIQNLNSAVITSQIQVQTNSSLKKYNFHYQFNDGKLQLFGPFDKSLYEILEINGDSHSIFLFYKENFYLLDENQTQITKLTLIKDDGVIKMLKEYRGR
jgi:hypothetical protein